MMYYMRKLAANARGIAVLSSSLLLVLPAAAFAACGGGDEAASDPPAEAGATDGTTSGDGADGGGVDGSASDAGDASADASSACTDGAVCNGSGLCRPIPACSSSSPCTNDGGTQTTVLPAIDCKTEPGSTRPIFDDNPPRTWSDAVTNEPRGACVFHPNGAGTASKRPLVVFFHGSAGAAQNVYDVTLLRAKSVDFDLTGDVMRPGFHLIAEQGRVLPNPNGNLGAAARRDIYFRDYVSPSSNPDVRNADRLVDEMVALGDVDPKRIYVMGWSNGAFFGAAYAIARHETPTPGGNKIAAAVLYAGGDPFQEFEPGKTECRLSPPPMTTLPVLLVHRSCDAAVACNAAQSTKFGQPPGYDNTAWLATLQGPMGASGTQRLLVAPDGTDAVACQAAIGCGQIEGLLAHVRWPDGVADGSGIDREPTMLTFLRTHPLP